MPIRLQLKSITPGRLADARTATVVVLADTIHDVAERVRNLEAAFPRIAFEIVHGEWPQPGALHADALIAGIDAASPASMDLATARLRGMAGAPPTIVVLRNADLDSTRRLVRDGAAADVLPDPVGDTALALSLERLLSRRRTATHGGKGQVVAFLKAGGGVGATALATQTAGMIAAQSEDPAKVCLADLDLQFGAAAFYLDVAGGTTITDCLEAGDALSDAPLARQLTAHRSGVRILAAPSHMTPLESIAPPLVDALFQGLRRDFALTFVDLPADWTAWTSRALELADHIVLVTHLSVPHTQLVRRQLATLQMQNLGATPLTLVCNALGGDQQSLVSVKAAERAIGRPFDILAPEDRKLMSSAINQGLLIGDVRRKTKLEKAITDLAATIKVKTALSQGMGA
jgi:pilus assembly protein CpaE